MEIYSRHIINRLWFLRFLFIILLFISIDSFSGNFQATGYVSVVVLIFTGLIRVSGLTIYHDSVKIERFYFFGCIPVRWLSDKNQKNAVRLVNKYEEIAITPSETLADLVIPFLPVEGKIQGVMIEYHSARGIKKSVLTSVNDKEYKILLSQFQQDAPETLK